MARLPLRQLLGWLEYFANEPAEEAANYRTASLLAGMANMLRTKGRPARAEDFLAKRKSASPNRQRRPTAKEMGLMFAQFARAHNACQRRKGAADGAQR